MARRPGRVRRGTGVGGAALNAADRDSLLALGAPIAVGRTAEVFADGEGRVLKLLRPAFPAALGEQEAQVAELVNRVYPGAPRLLATRTVAGRFGLVYERIPGPSMEQLLLRRPWSIDRLARTLGELHATMHQASGAGLADQHAKIRGAIERAEPELPSGARVAALRRLEGLPSGDAVCHGDLHPGNVLVTTDRAVVIDWENARRGNPVADVARTLYLTLDTPSTEPLAMRPLVRAARARFTRVYVARYRDLRPIDQAELRAWRLPILAARVAEGIEEERASLRASIARELSPA